MAIKKKVTYTVNYTAGTDTLTTQLNSLLNSMVTLILNQNTELTTLDTITVGSERWTGAPLYDTYNSKLYSNDYNNRHYESDVVFIGTDEDNVCLSLGFFDGCLVVAMNMTPKVEAEYVTIWNSTYGLNANTYLPFYATGKCSRWFKSTMSNAGRYCIPYRIVNNAISMSVIYWTGEYSRGYSFVNGADESDGVDLVIFSTDEGSNNEGIGAAIWTWGRLNTSGSYYYNAYRRAQIAVFSFAENLSNNKPEKIPTSTNQAEPSQANQQIINARNDIRVWYSAQNNTANGSSYFANFTNWHTLCGSDSEVTNSGTNLNSPYLWGSVNRAVTGSASISSIDPLSGATIVGFSPLVLPYNLPHLEAGQAYVRKMRIPGWNPNCKGEIYLLWSPVLDGYKSGDIVEVGNKSYAVITEGAVCWAARVS
jgi:hypothetical protein